MLRGFGEGALVVDAVELLGVAHEGGGGGALDVLTQRLGRADLDAGDGEVGDGLVLGGDVAGASRAPCEHGRAGRRI